MKITARIIFLSLLILVIFSLPEKRLSADIVTCTANSSPQSVPRNTTSVITITVENTDSADYHFVDITVPNDNITITGYSSNWSVVNKTDQITFSGGTIIPGNSANFLLQVQSADVDTAAEDWSVDASDASDGSNSAGCDGSLSLEISGAAPDTTPPVVSDVTVSAVSTTSVTLTWTTDEAAQTSVDYGLTDGYGSTVTQDGYDTSHSASITGLSAETQYHFVINAADELGNSMQTDDATFTTAETGTVQTVTTTVTNTVTNTVTRTITPTPTPTPTPDLVPPTIKMKGEFAKSYKKAPDITGSAYDVSGVAKVSYSLDGGKNWIPAEEFKATSATVGTFTISPGDLLDDTYDVRIEAWDTKGNAGILKAGKMVIDRLPPIIGPVIFSAGPVELTSDEQGIVTVSDSMNTKVTLSAIGGPTEITINLLDDKLNPLPRTPVILNKDPQSGLWSGDVDFSASGVYGLKVVAVDGAFNHTEKTLNNVRVANSGHISFSNTNVLPSTSVNLIIYVQEPVSHQFIVWDGRPFGQSNPVPVAGDGNYSLFLPPGKYLLRVSASGYKVFTSNIFNLDRATVISSDITLDPLQSFRLAGFQIVIPDVFPKHHFIQTVSRQSGQGKSSLLIGQKVPEFQLTKDQETEVSDLDLTGKKSVIAFVNSWHPQASSQVLELDKFAKMHPDMNVLVIMSQESIPAEELFFKRLGVNLNAVADPDGTTIVPFQVEYLPYYVFINSDSVVTSVRTGLLSVDEISSEFLN